MTDDIRKAGPPRNLTVLSVISGATSGVNLAWDAPADTPEPNGYTVEWAGNPEFRRPLCCRVAPGQHTVGIVSLVPGVTIYIRVAALSGGVYGEWSAPVSATPASLLTTADVPPDAILAELKALNANVIELQRLLSRRPNYRAGD